MGFLSLGDYGLIGNQSSCALVSRLGSVDWCCFPYLDSPSHFAAILDDNQGGRFQIVPQGDFRSEQRTIQRTHVLETLFETPNGRAVLTDWMPMDPLLSSEPQIHRQIEMIEGQIQWSMTCAPRFNYGATAGEAEYRGDSVLFRGKEPLEFGEIHSRQKLEILASGNSAASRFTLDAGQRTHFIWSWGRRIRRPEPVSPRATVDYWRARAHHCPTSDCLFAGPWHDAVSRSGLLLKLLLSPFSGSIAEAVTTSLPGISGAGRTWDYRYAWVRDSAMAVQGLAALGYREESEAFFNWLCDVVIRDGAEGLQPVYTLDGGRLLPERELDYLAGYQGSRPVRVGNQSSGQFHLDIFGHVLVAAHEHFRAFGNLPPRLWGRLAEIAEYVCQAWRRPDHGPWEVRSKPEHFVASKVLCWAALDRAILLAREIDHSVPSRWIEERKILHRTICSQGFDSNQQSFVRSFGDSDLDASSLLIPMLGFLPFDDPRIQGTMNAIHTQLSNGVWVYRYRSSDGLQGPDGPHLGSSFLYVSCLALSGQIEEASNRLAELCTYATPLGLLGEQVDSDSHETTGNFPSAAVHLAMINAGVYVGMARGRRIPIGHVLGEAA